MGKSEVFDDAIAAYAMAYADQTNHDHGCLLAALDPKTGLPSRAGGGAPQRH
jgi:hypothetical protein